MTSCLYIAGKCHHQECQAWWDGEYTGYYDGPQPTEFDYCAGGGHMYYGDDWWDEDTLAGRCYCGFKTYQAGGPNGS